MDTQDTPAIERNEGEGLDDLIELVSPTLNSWVDKVCSKVVTLIEASQERKIKKEESSPSE